MTIVADFGMGLIPAGLLGPTAVHLQPFVTPRPAAPAVRPLVPSSSLSPPSRPMFPPAARPLAPPPPPSFFAAFGSPASPADLRAQAAAVQASNVANPIGSAPWVAKTTQFAALLQQAAALDHPASSPSSSGSAFTSPSSSGGSSSDPSPFFDPTTTNAGGGVYTSDPAPAAVRTSAALAPGSSSPSRMPSPAVLVAGGLALVAVVGGFLLVLRK